MIQPATNLRGTEASYSLPRLLCYCTLSRIILVLAIIVSNVCLPDHNAQGVYTFEFQKDEGVVASSWLSFTKWDAAYFLQISRHGYQFESSFAFFPLYPTCIHFVGKGIAFTTALSLDLSAIVAGVLISNVCFLITVTVLWYLLKELNVANKVIFQSLVLFCINPANVFFSSIYSESFYSSLAFTAMLCWEKRWFGSAMLLFVLASGTRSNGIINAVFVFSHSLINQFLHMTKVFRARSGHSREGGRRPNRASYVIYFSRGVLVGSCCCVCTLSYVVYSAFAHHQLCSRTLLSSKLEMLASIGRSLPETWSVLLRDYLTVPVMHASCDEGSVCSAAGGGLRDVMFPCTDQSYLAVYGSIQRNFWNVGFMRYYSLRQAPNFCLAAPVFLLCLWICMHYYQRYSCCHKSTTAKFKGTNKVYIFVKSLDLFLCRDGNALPYVLHMVVVALVALAFAHIQISTRLIFSSCPLVCYHICHILQCEKLSEIEESNSQCALLPQESLHEGGLVVLAADTGGMSSTVGPSVPLASAGDSQRHSGIIAAYFVIFSAAGVFMHPNSLPWT